MDDQLSFEDEPEPQDTAHHPYYEDPDYQDWLNELMENAGEEWDGDDSMEHIAIRYVRFLEARVKELEQAHTDHWQSREDRRTGLEYAVMAWHRKGIVDQVDEDKILGTAIRFEAHLRHGAITTLPQAGELEIIEELDTLDEVLTVFTGSRHETKTWLEDFGQDDATYYLREETDAAPEH